MSCSGAAAQSTKGLGGERRNNERLSYSEDPCPILVLQMDPRKENRACCRKGDSVTWAVVEPGLLCPPCPGLMLRLVLFLSASPPVTNLCVYERNHTPYAAALSSPKLLGYLQLKGKRWQSHVYPPWVISGSSRVSLYQYTHLVLPAAAESLCGPCKSSHLPMHCHLIPLQPQSSLSHSCQYLA